MGMGGVGRGTGTGGGEGQVRGGMGEGGALAHAGERHIMQGEKQVISGRNNIQGRINFNITFPLANTIGNSGGVKYDKLMLIG